MKKKLCLFWTSGQQKTKNINLTSVACFPPISGVVTPFLSPPLLVVVTLFAKNQRKTVAHVSVILVNLIRNFDLILHCKIFYVT